MKILWTDPALEDLRSIHTYIARDALAYADQFVARIITAVDHLQEFPEMGRIVPEAQLSHIRELCYQRYRIIYRVETERVAVLTIVHGNRDLSDTNPKPWELS